MTNYFLTCLYQSEIFQNKTAQATQLPHSFPELQLVKGSKQKGLGPIKWLRRQKHLLPRLMC